MLCGEKCEAAEICWVSPRRSRFFFCSRRPRNRDLISISMHGSVQAPIQRRKGDGSAPPSLERIRTIIASMLLLNGSNWHRCTNSAFSNSAREISPWCRGMETCHDLMRTGLADEQGTISSHLFPAPRRHKVYQQARYADIFFSLNTRDMFSHRLI